MVYTIKNNKHHFFSLLYCVDALFKKYDIEYWLDCGSLLGAIREGTYIDWDDDMDISIHFKDVQRVRDLKDEFKLYGITLVGFVSLGVKYMNASMCIFPQHTVERNSRSYLVQYRYPLYHWVNHFLPKLSSMLEKSKLYWYICSKVKLLETIRSPLNYLGNFAYVDFCRTVCPIPEYPDKYLSYMFGNWRVPHYFMKHKDVDNMYNRKWKK